MSVYDGMFILDAGRYSRDPEGVPGQISKVIQEEGGEVLVSRLWEERRLAYSIKGQRKGVYWLTYFRLDGTKLAAVRQKFRLSDSILRMLFVKVDPRIVDTLVSHALAGPAPLTAERRSARIREAEVREGDHQENQEEVSSGKEEALSGKAAAPAGKRSRQKDEG